jgi:hypothetical protein
MARCLPACGRRQKWMPWQRSPICIVRGGGASARRAKITPVTIPLEHGGRRFQVMAYHDAMRHDGPALELAELVGGELGPAIVTVMFADERAGGAEVLLADSGLPLPILRAFMKEVVQEEHRICGAGLPGLGERA